jgi:hypothetical protein
MADGGFYFRDLVVDRLPRPLVLTEPVFDGFQFPELVEFFHDLVVVMANEIELAAEEDERRHQVIEGLVPVADGDRFVEDDLSKVFAEIAGDGLAPPGGNEVVFAGGKAKGNSVYPILFFLCHKMFRFKLDGFPVVRQRYILPMAA